MSIHKDKCLELGLPEPESYDTQIAYVIKTISNGYRLDTRMARYIGIHNLHSIASKLAKSGFKFTLKHGLAKCYYTKTTPPQNVDIVFMTSEQIAIYKKEKAAKNLIKATS